MRIKTQDSAKMNILILLFLFVFSKAGYSISDTLLPRECTDSDGDCLFSNINLSNDIYESTDLFTSPYGWLNATNFTKIPQYDVINNANLSVEWHTDTGLGAADLIIEYFDGISWINCTDYLSESESDITSNCNISQLSAAQLNNISVKFRGNDEDGSPNAFSYVDLIKIDVEHAIFIRIPTQCQDSDGDCVFSNINSSDNTYENVDLSASPLGYITASDWDIDIPEGSYIQSATAKVEWYTDTGYGASGISIDFWNGTAWVLCAGPFSENGVEQVTSCNMADLNTTQLNDIMIRFSGVDTDGSPNAIAYVDYIGIEANYSELIVPGYLETQLITPYPDIVTNLLQNQTFTVNATVYCRINSCGYINGTVRYNVSAIPDTPVNTTQGGAPFYIQEAGATATKNCPSSLYKDQNCSLSWTLNATGNIGTIWGIDVIFMSPIENVSSNNTKQANISIISCGVDFSLQWQAIGFGNILPNSVENEASGNSNDLYNITINSLSCLLDLYIKGENLTNSTYGSQITINNLSWSNSSNNYLESHELTETYSLMKYGLPPESNMTTWYWLNLPPVPAGEYTGNITITGVLNGQSI